MQSCDVHIELSGCHGCHTIKVHALAPLNAQTVRASQVLTQLV